MMDNQGIAVIDNKDIEEKLRSSPSVSTTNSRDLYNASEPLSLLHINSPLCKAVISLQGAQLLEFSPTDSHPWLWLSPKAVFSPGQTIRGGIPICAPWFGVNQKDPTKPKHGFVRNQPWQLVSVFEDQQGVVELHFQFTPAEQALALYPHTFKLDLKITLSDHIDISFSVHNISNKTMLFSWALHSYFSIDSLADVQVTGLDQHDYLDATEQFAAVRQNGPVRFRSEVDRVYESVGLAQQIQGTPNLSVSGHNCPTAIVWNPGEKLAQKMADVGIEHYDEYICVERGAAFANSWRIEPGNSETARLIIKEKL
ncbi:D-hexose-6-phosphate mutarotase [Alkalimarinus coralli]|uniref:D-hexose-6-phosphate mutarotase n=1 Tax=Alkalimarinus coralli TaxID=2935863 RepID=UPI00202B190C|nr:D-hexose-6-phosphate mutarotase [Alkalimarinus coralli]